MVGNRPVEGRAQVVIHGSKKLAASYSGPGHGFDDVEAMEDGFPGFMLSICGFAIHDYAARVVGEIAAVRGTKIQDIYLSRLGCAIGTGWTAHCTACKIVSEKCRERFFCR